MDKSSSNNSSVIDSGSRSPPTTTTTSRGSSASVKTSREVTAKPRAAAAAQVSNREDEDQDETSTPVQSVSRSLTDSRSSADIPSELLDDDSESDSDSQQSDEEQETEISPPDNESVSKDLVHGHILPAGWTCKYDSSTNQYRFEHRHHQTISHELRTKIDAKSSKQDQSVLAQTPTQDDTVQTSRRPTLHQFECKYGYHFPSSPTSSMISDLAIQVHKSLAGQTGEAGKRADGQKSIKQIGYGKHKLVVPSDEDEQAARLRDMFPTATEPIIEQIIRIYHGREGLIKAALISLGYKRSTEYSVQKAAAQSPIMLMMSKPSSKKLFDKLMGYFPDKDENLIKSMMYKYKEVEHEIISALVESSQEGGGGSSGVEGIAQKQSRLDSALRADRNGAIMKLRYLKFLYPKCEEIELYHLLNCNDLNAQKVMELIEQRGHKSINVEEVMQNRKSQMQQMRAQQAAHAAKDKATSSASDLVQAHLKRPKPTVTEARRSNHVASLKKSFDQLQEGLIMGALVATDYNEALARKFLEEMAPANEAAYKQRYERKRSVRPNVVAFPCKSTQKDSTDLMAFISSDEYVYIAREVIDCDHALALLKVDASTFTGDDFPKQKFTHRLGRQPDLACGASMMGKKETRSGKQTLHRGPTVDRSGSKYREIVCLDSCRPQPNKAAVGRNKSLVNGSNLNLRCGHNADLVKRIHPFFKKEEAQAR